MSSYRTQGYMYMRNKQVERAWERKGEKCKPCFKKSVFLIVKYSSLTKLICKDNFSSNWNSYIIHLRHKGLCGFRKLLFCVINQYDYTAEVFIEKPLLNKLIMPWFDTSQWSSCRKALLLVNTMFPMIIIVLFVFLVSIPHLSTRHLE